MKKEKTIFYRCPVCGNIIEVINSSGIAPFCCGRQMEVLEANVTDGIFEKHVPVISIDGDICSVYVGESTHPMQEDHWIMWIYLETEHGSQLKKLSPGEKPQAEFILHDDKVLAAYAYCNKHKLWKVKN